jgi:hypothetical protein
LAAASRAAFSLRFCAPLFGLAFAAGFDPLAAGGFAPAFGAVGLEVFFDFPADFPGDFRWGEAFGAGLPAAAFFGAAAFAGSGIPSTRRTSAQYLDVLLQLADALRLREFAESLFKDFVELDRVDELGRRLFTRRSRLAVRGNSRRAARSCLASLRFRSHRNVLLS